MERTKIKAAHALLKLALPLSAGTGFLVSVYLRFYSGLIPVTDFPFWPAYIGYFALSIAVWSVLEFRYGLTETCISGDSFPAWTALLLKVNLLTLVLVSCAAFFWRGYSFSRYTVLAFWSLHTVFSVIIGWAARAWVSREPAGAATYVFSIGYDIPVERVKTECLQGGSLRVHQFEDATGVIKALETFEAPADCCEILVVVPSREAARLAELSAAADRQAVPCAVAVEGLGSSDIHRAGSFVVFSNGPPAADAFDYILLKRLFDLAISAAGLILLGPVMAVICVIIWIRSGPPVFLAQERVGRGGRHFWLYKFRTLPVVSLASSATDWAPEASDAWGRFLRRTGLDELPQLWNVLRGQMSLVGPRPERPYFVKQFRRQLPFYAIRHRLEAGITGWAQVNGWRGDTSIPTRVEHDLYYLRHWSLAFDLRILWMTFRNFLRHCAGFSTPPAGAPHARSF